MIKVYTTGGSIDKIYSTQCSTFIVGQPQSGRILREANVGFKYEVVPLLAKDSLDLTPTDRQTIVEAVRSDPCEQILITHGTDSLIETAKALSPVERKTIVLTGAMQPAALKESDAAFNLGCAAIALQTLPHGVYIVMNGQVFDPNRVRKDRRLDRFETVP
ncbi:MAG: asparaginase domain-containing protein [Anaerolineae bacterium]|jgi:L-asparaginase